MEQAVEEDRPIEQEKLDVNHHNGPTKSDEFKAAFQFFSINMGDSSAIKVKDMRAVMFIVGQNPTLEDMDKMLQDLNKTEHEEQLVTFEEFEMVFNKYAKNPDEVKSLLVEAFKNVDTDGNGYIDRNEMTTMLLSMGEPIDENIITEAFDQADLNKDGKIDYYEFVKMIT